MNLEKLFGPLNLEKKRGYKNDSVIGGFDRFVLSFLNSIDDSTIKDLFTKLFSNYANASTEERVKIIEKAESFIKEYNSKSTNALNRIEPQTKAANVEYKKLSELFTDVQYVKGIGPKLSSKLKKLGINYAFDLLYYFPRGYLDLRNVKKIYSLESGEVALIKVKILSLEEKKGKLNILTMLATDGTGYINPVWFNQPYLKNIFKVGMEVYLFGKVQFSYGKWEMPSPDYEIPQGGKELLHTLRIIPIYPLTEGLGQKILRAKIKNFLDEVAPRVFDYIEDEILKRNNLVPLNFALSNVHFPDSFDDLKKAKERLIFNELFELQYVLGRRKHEIETSEGFILKSSEEDIVEFSKLLPFELTNDQKKVMNEIIKDFQSGHPMNRLLHGDVGSGKTVVALFAAYVAVKNGFQVAIMSPTEILAEQTYNNAINIFKNLPFKLSILTSSTRKKERTEILEGLETSKINIIFGTHALLEESVKFSNLGLVVVDEQHRFGVLQRGILKGKAVLPHTLVMSATPIPRTLALTLYGDLDVSKIVEMPKGRKPIVTKVFYNDDLTAYNLVKEELNRGHKAYVVCPLIEDSESLEVQSVQTLFEKLTKGYLKGYNIGKLFGSMSGNEKAKVMDDFRSGKIQVLVSTTVVEVGVDVKDATVIVIEDADRFGLATLHQLRGRVGRGDLQSYCFLITRNPSKLAIERLRILEKTTNGFEVAEEDLRLRGPGEILGTKQSGLPDLKLASFLSESDIKMLEIARKEAFALLKKEIEFDKEKFEELNRVISKKYKGKINLIEVG